MSGHKYVPWRDVKGWRCLRCGKCCIDYLVELTPGEAIYYATKYGPVVFKYRNKFFLLPKPDGSCIFLRKYNGIYYCSIYYDRPRVCRLYPFYISYKSLRRDDKSRAEFNYNGETIYIYIDKECPGVDKARNIKELIPRVIRLWYKLGMNRI